jgi:membrane-bound serine protease (ClpP class)
MPLRIALAVLALTLSSTPSRAAGDVHVIPIQGAIQDIQAEILSDAISRAEDEGAALLIIELDTPGGLMSSMRDMVQAIMGSRVPTAVHVAPSGARAASAGFFLLMSGDVAAMATGTTTGAAHPVMAIGGLFPINPDDVDPTMMEKTTNDAVAFLRGTATSRGRDPDQAELAITENHSWTAAEAADAALIDVIADDSSALVARLDGVTVARTDGRAVVLDLEGATLSRATPSARQQALLFLANPILALLMALAGLALLYFEFTHPGAIAPAVVGGLLIVLSLLGFSFLPVNAVGVILVVGGIGLLLVEVFMPGFGVFGIAGLVALSFGSVVLIKAPIPEMRIPLAAVLTLTIPFAALVVFLGRLAVAAHRRRTVTGQEGMPGQTGEVERALAPEGMVFVAGELWRARSTDGDEIAVGERVRVTSIDGLDLVVAPLARATERQQGDEPGDA